ncbi:MAG: hypothetical protein ABJA67_14635 [Chthonomonadales bacterium]
MKRIICAIVGAVSVMSVVGCGRMSATTEVQPNGNWTRKLVYHYPAPVPKDQGLLMGPQMEKIFGVPSGPEWKIVKTTDKDKDKDEVVMTCTRSYTSGQITPAFGLLKDEMGKATLTDTVIVKSAGPGRWEYRETLHWTGPKSKMTMDKMDNDFTKSFKEALPAGVVTAADVLALQKPIVGDFWHLMFGPSEPMISEIIMHPDYAQRKLQRKAVVILDKRLQEHFGSRLTQEQRRTIVRKLVNSATTTANESSKSKADPGKADKSSDPSEMIPLTFSVKLPGKIVSSNGEVDDVSGEVYWAMYAISPQWEDVTLTAICEVGK